MATGKKTTTKRRPNTRVEISAPNRKGRNKRHRLSKKTIFITIAFVVFCFFGFFLFATLGKQEFITSSFLNEREIEYSENYNEDYGKICHGNLFFCNDVEIKSEGEVDTKKLGEYTIKYHIKYHDETLDLEQKVKVVDKTPPAIAVLEEPAVACPNGKNNSVKFKSIDNYDGDITEKAETELKNGEIVIKSRDSSGNYSEKTVKAKVEDKTAPVITIKGSNPETIITGSGFIDDGADASDNCGEIGVHAEGEVDDTTPGEYTITYTATDDAGNTTEEKRIVNVIAKSSVAPGGNGVQGNKVIYLTFDDGPGEYTNKLLDILKKYNVKVTFFVTGAGSDDIIKREYNEGHAVALHTNSHNYAYVYSSISNYFADLYAIQERVKNITGYTSTLIRFPGGSSNMVSAYYDGGTRIMSQLVNEVTARGFTYFDWNISSGDAGGVTTAKEVYANVVNNLKAGSSVVLQHDIKGFSVDAVEDIIKYGLSNGYTFSKLDANSYAAHHGINN